jgi:hypothetical protein
MATTTPDPNAPQTLSPGTMLAISALSSLAKAGGQGALAYFTGEQSADQLRFEKRKWIKEQQDAEKQRTLNAMRTREADNAQRPMNSVNLLTGLSNLAQGMAKPSSLDYLGLLARG